jgi:hypothetical protein
MSESGFQFSHLNGDFSCLDSIFETFFMIDEEN